MLDTGASFVTLTPRDAERAGVDTGALDFATPIRTANGEIRAAEITLETLQVGPIERHQIAALVAPPNSLDQSLLGLSFLNTLKGYSITAAPGLAPPRVSITDAAHRVVFARLGSRVRVAGVADLGSYGTSIDPERLAVLIRSARAALPNAAQYDALEASWAGLRPMTPTSLPITRTIAPRVIANTGHGALGWTHAAGSAQRVADLVEGVVAP